MMKLNFFLEDTATECEVTGPFSLLETYDPEDEVTLDDITYLPIDAQYLKWYLIKQFPCLWGDDLRVAFDHHSHYVIHDQVCDERRLVSYESLEEDLKAIAAGEDLTDPDERMERWSSPE